MSPSLSLRYLLRKYMVFSVHLSISRSLYSSFASGVGCSATDPPSDIQSSHCWTYMLSRPYLALDLNPMKFIESIQFTKALSCCMVLSGIQSFLEMGTF